jgi:hypothetical protein
MQKTATAQIKMLRFSIAEPCHERWDKMTPVEKGVFCGSCKKTVTDFSGMNDEEILDHLSARNFQPSCGRFRNDQLNRPLVYISPEVLTMDIPLWKKFLAALFICFSGLLVSCENSQQPRFESLPDPAFNVPVPAKKIAPPISEPKETAIHRPKPDSCYKDKKGITVCVTDTTVVFGNFYVIPETNK